MKAPSEEIYDKSTQGTRDVFSHLPKTTKRGAALIEYHWKVHSVVYNAVADNTGLSSFD